MVRKRIIRWLAGVILLALVVCTVVSNSVYQASLPRVRTRVVEQEVGDLLDGYGIFIGTAEQADSLDPDAVVARESQGYGGVRCLVRRSAVPATLTLERPTVEDIILFLVKGVKSV